MEHLTVPESKEMLTMEAHQKQKAKTNKHHRSQPEKAPTGQM